MVTHSGSVLAFIGDAMLSLQVREHLVSLGYTKAKDLQQKSTLFVSAKAQADYMEQLLKEDRLDEVEMTMYKRGRNDKSTSIAKNAEVITYRVATGFEALWGYLYLEDKERLQSFWLEYCNYVHMKYPERIKGIS